MNLNRFRAIAFDLDDTLAHSKSAISPRMAQLLISLAEVMPTCVISGGRFEQFEQQLLSNLPLTERAANHLHLMPTCGTRYFRISGGAWTEVYAEDLTAEEKKAAVHALERSAKRLGLWMPDSQVFGPRIEDRGSQITYSALGQQAPVRKKKDWDPSGSKRRELQSQVQRDLPDLEVRAGGSTSIDITRKGIDKAHGIREFSEIVKVPFHEILFVGDRLEPGGNDYPVVGLGVQTIAVRNCEETEELLPLLIARAVGSD